MLAVVWFSFGCCFDSCLLGLCGFWQWFVVCSFAMRFDCGVVGLVGCFGLFMVMVWFVWVCFRLGFGGLLFALIFRLGLGFRMSLFVLSVCLCVGLMVAFGFWWRFRGGCGCRLDLLVADC